MLTGITTAMVAGAPRLPAVLPTFLEFIRGAVLVAHNAPVRRRVPARRVRAARPARGRARLCSAPRAWPAPCSPADEAPSVRLGALAQLFGTTTQPTHRALADARATVDVLHGLFERVGQPGRAEPRGAAGLARESAPHRPTQAQRQKRRAGRPACRRRPGCTSSAAPATRCSTSAPAATCDGGCAATSPRASTAAGSREMVALAERVDTVVCAHALEAAVRELRLIAAHQPPLQPPLPPSPSAGWWVTPDRRGVPAAVGGHHAPGRGHWARSAPGRRPPPRSTPCSTRCRCGRARSASRRVERPRSPCALARARPVRRAVRRAADAPRSTPPPSRRCTELIDGRDDTRARARWPTQVDELAGRERFEEAARAPGPAGRPDRGARTRAAPGRTGRGARAGRRPARRPRRLGARGDAVRPAGRRRRAPAGASPRCRWSTRCGSAPRPCSRSPGRCAVRPPRRCACCTAGSHGRHPAGPRRTAAGPSGRARRGPLERPWAERAPAAWRSGVGAKVADAAGPTRGAVVITAIVMMHTAADRIPETAQAIADLDGVERGLLLRRRGRPDRHRQGRRARADRRGDRRAAQQGRRACGAPTPTSRSARTRAPTSRPPSPSGSTEALTTAAASGPSRQRAQRRRQAGRPVHRDPARPAALQRAAAPESIASATRSSAEGNASASRAGGPSKATTARCRVQQHRVAHRTGLARRQRAGTRRR